jgi:hypothetical protein
METPMTAAERALSRIAAQHQAALREIAGRIPATSEPHQP